MEEYIATRYDAADFRPTPDLFNGVENVALQYAFTYLGYTQPVSYTHLDVYKRQAQLDRATAF